MKFQFIFLLSIFFALGCTPQSSNENDSISMTSHPFLPFRSELADDSSLVNGQCAFFEEEKLVKCYLDQEWVDFSDIFDLRPIPKIKHDVEKVKRASDALHAYFYVLNANLDKHMDADTFISKEALRKILSKAPIIEEARGHMIDLMVVNNFLKENENGEFALNVESVQWMEKLVDKMEKTFGYTQGEKDKMKLLDIFRRPKKPYPKGTARFHESWVELSNNRIFQHVGIVHTPYLDYSLKIKFGKVKLSGKEAEEWVARMNVLFFLTRTSSLIAFTDWNKNLEIYNEFYAIPDNFEKRLHPNAHRLFNQENQPFVIFNKRRVDKTYVCLDAMVNDFVSDLTYISEAEKIEADKFIQDRILTSTVPVYYRSKTDLHSDSTKMGGHPYLSHKNDHPRCSACNNEMQLVFQLQRENSPMEFEGDLFQHFACNVFSCKKDFGTDFNHFNDFYRTVKVKGKSFIPDGAKPKFDRARIVTEWKEVENYPRYYELDLDSLSRLQRIYIKQSLGFVYNRNSFFNGYPNFIQEPRVWHEVQRHENLELMYNLPGPSGVFRGYVYKDEKTGKFFTDWQTD